ncbi:MAG: glycoside hydrolase family 38 C-terminal domain-containing protein [Bacillota bacterium]|jgi:alpha-mannosidase|nr:glycoside hydrolase family 38 C-terminal domain-containing protein [Bacillota bacterium]HHU43528.1 alpha-mannosidase [Clostridiales bacterium]
MYSMYKMYLKTLCHPDLLRNLNRIKSKVYKKEAKLEAKYVVEKEPIPFAERTKNLKSIKTCRKWGDVFDCAWFNFKGVVPASAKGKKIQLMIALDGEGCLFDDEGNPVKGLSNICGVVELFQPSKGKKILDFCDSAVGGEEVDVWVEAGHNKLSVNIKNYAIFKQADIVSVREDTKALYYDYFCLLLQLITLDKSTNKYCSIKNALRNSIKEAKGFSPESVEKARNILQKELINGEKSDYTAYAMGHAHLDLAWLWPIRETKRKVSRTFSNTVYNIENFPEYIFGVSQPQQLEWMKELYPNLYKQVKDYILQGRIEPQGKMWVECDTNVTSGESLIRQSIYGERFWQDEFKKSPKMCWLPDVFGFNGNLPQIIKKCGMDYFLTIKLSWNKQNVFPHRTFMWEGIDKSRVLAHMPPEGNYNSDATPVPVHAALKKNSEKEVVKTFGLPFGVGDGGGGPGEGHLECAIRQKDIAVSPRVKFAFANELFEELDKVKEELPVYKGELYLETHQGTYTAQAKVKYYNRLLEKALHTVEFLATYAFVKKGVKYPYEKLDKIWKEVLLYQFHDIIPGSSIKRVYDECVPAYQRMYEELIILREKLLKQLSAGSNLCAFNPTSYPRKEYIKHGEKYYFADIPPYASKKLTPADTVKMSSMENDLIKLEFGEDGEITSLYHKGLKQEFCKDYLNVLRVYKDKRTHYDAWDIDFNYANRCSKTFKLVGYKQFQEGASIIRESIYKYNKSTLTQRVILTMGKPYVEFFNSIEWQETHKMLRAEFAPRFFSDEVTCDIQFGNIKRSTKNDTSVEKAQFEICAHKWVDVSKDGYGISLLNDCKYGHRVKDGVISLNLLRSPMWPAKDADKGIHTFTYALYPHKGDCYEGETAKMGYVLNNPLIVNRSEFDSFVYADKPNIVIETVKMAENKEKEFIIRAYEDSGKQTKAKLTIDTPYSEVCLTDMLENKIEDVSLDELIFTPFEIKTIKVTL